MKAITRTADYADLIEEHTYIQRLISEGSLADVLITFYELRLTEIENEISDYNEKVTQQRGSENWNKHQS